MITDIRIKKLRDTAKIPTRGSNEAAGYDLYADIQSPVRIEPGSVMKIGTGSSTQLPPCMAALIFPRSGLSTKKGLRLANCVGLVDPDYRGEYIVALYNDSETPQIVMPGERIAQVVFSPFYEINFIEADELNGTERGEGGFGASGQF